MNDKIILPKDATAEYIALGTCFSNEIAAKNVMTNLQASDFHTPEMKILYEIMKKCFESTGKIIFYDIMHRSYEQGLMSQISLKTLNDISNCHSSSYDYYIDKLKMVSAKRKAVSILQDNIYSFCDEKTEYGECVQNVVSELSCQYQNSDVNICSCEDIHNDFNDGKDFETNLLETVKMIREGKNHFKGIPTNFQKMDEILGGLQNGSLTYIGARSHMGKTTFMLNLIAQIGCEVPMAVMTLEMPKKSLYENFVSILAQENHYQVSSGMLSDRQVANTLQASKLAKSYKIYWEEYGEATINTICNRARKLLIVKGIKVLFIDYLTCISGGKSYSSKHMEVTDISKKLQALSKDLNIPIVCLAQLNRESAKTCSRPSLTDFRESGSIEQDADTCLLLHRPAYYDPYSKPG